MFKRFVGITLASFGLGLWLFSAGLGKTPLQAGETHGGAGNNAQPQIGRAAGRGRGENSGGGGSFKKKKKKTARRSRQTKKALYCHASDDDRGGHVRVCGVGSDLLSFGCPESSMTRLGMVRVIVSGKR